MLNLSDLLSHSIRVFKTTTRRKKSNQCSTLKNNEHTIVQLNKFAQVYSFVYRIPLGFCESGIAYNWNSTAYCLIPRYVNINVR